MGKYAPLTRFLREQEKSRITLSFRELEEILGFSLPASAFNYASWWANSAVKQSQVKGWREAGWEARDVDLRGCKVTFLRVSGEPVATVNTATHAPAAVSGAGGAVSAQASKTASAAAVAGEVSAAGEGAGAVRSAAGVDGGDDALAVALDQGRLPAAARRLLESRAARQGRRASEEMAALLKAALAEEQAALLDDLRQMRERTQRPGGFDLLEVMGRK